MRALLMVDVLLGGLCGVALVLTYRYLWVPTNIASFRQSLFGLRRKLFLYAADGGVSFSDPAYLQLNDTINGLIGFADKVTVFEALLCALLVQRRGPITDATAEAICAIEKEETRQEMMTMHRLVHIEITRHLASTSPLFWLLALPVGFYFYVSYLLRGASPSESASAHLQDGGFPARAIEAGVRARGRSSGTWTPWSGEAAA